MKLTGIIIARNEGKNIGECIKSLRICDEIIVVDNGSNDRTVNNALKNKAKVIQIKEQDFSLLRNTGKSEATGDWLIYLDADERLSGKLSAGIKKILNNSDNIAAYSLSRVNYFYGVKWPNPEEVIRIVRRDKLDGWRGRLHESPVVSGKIGRLNLPIYHYTHNDFSSMVNKTNDWSEIEADLRFKSGHPLLTWWRFFRVMMTAFLHSYMKGEGWKKGTYGLIEGTYQAFSIFITYAKLWEKQQKTTR